MDINSVLIAEKENKKRIDKRAGRAIAVASASCTLLLILQIISALIAPQFDDEVIMLLINIAVYVFYMFVPFAIAKLAYVTLFKNDKSFFVKRATPKKPVLYILGAIGIGYLLNLAVNLIFGWLLNNDNQSIFEVPETPLGVILTYLMMAVLPAIIEEWAFRGVLLKHLRPYGRAGAIVISSFLFGLMHIDIARVIFATAFGILLGICYDHTGSLKFSMLIHFINNAISVTMTLVLDKPVLAAILSLFVYVFIAIGIGALIYYLLTGIARKKVSIIKPVSHGYRLNVPTFIRKTVLNFAFVPLAGMYVFFLILLYTI